ncbi:unnamed protein product [Rhodiola kirilowii]
MGCRHSKQAVVVESPTFEFSVAIGSSGSLVLDSSLKNPSRFRDKGKAGEEKSIEPSKLSSRSSSARFSVSFRLGSLRRSVEAEQAAAGWPTWLTAVASEAIHGMVPLPADNFVKMAKIGQGTYSSVFRARDVETGRMVALKKVRFDNVQQESIRFMAREIMILRRLNHPNIIRLEGIITSRLSSSIYLVFEYMEHDLSDLINSPEIKFTESQVKCYMKQLLAGIEHCHSKSIMHRDIKASNILLNNQGILKVADFGLANLYSSRHKRPLTSRVVTLWYRPPELLLGSTSYGVSVDLWSIGCVFAELLLGKPILKGRTEVEQLHKIMKLCGSPPEEFWQKSKLPYATMFKPHQPYVSSLRERYRDLPEPSLRLLETLLSIEPQKRGTASSALLSEYFQSWPLAWSPSSLPKYPPTKEIDARCHEDSRKHYKETEKTLSSNVTTKSRRMKTAGQHSRQTNAALNHRIDDGSSVLVPDIKRSNVHGLPLKPSLEGPSEMSKAPHSSSLTESIAYARADPARTNLNNGKTRGSYISYESSHTTVGQEAWSWRQGHVREVSEYFGTKIGARDSYKIDRHTILKLKQRFERPESYDESTKYHSQHLTSTSHDSEGGRDEDDKERFEFSGPLLSQWEYAGDELLQRHDQQMRQALHKTQMHRTRKQK